MTIGISRQNKTRSCYFIRNSLLAGIGVFNLILSSRINREKEERNTKLHCNTSKSLQNNNGNPHVISLELSSHKIFQKTSFYSGEGYNLIRSPGKCHNNPATSSRSYWDYSPHSLRSGIISYSRHARPRSASAPAHIQS